MVRIKNLVHTSWQTASTSLESRVVISAREVFDVFCEYGETTCHPAENGSYVICIRDTCNVHIDNYYGLHGWGFQGHHGIKVYTATEIRLTALISTASGTMFSSKI
ncbi:hypothetical protein WIB42_15135 [Klebsiella pneumoniae]